MQILLLSPLYPPDIAPPAPYVKELLQRLAGTADVSLLTYGRLPEGVTDVLIVAIDKRRLLPVRLFAYTAALIQMGRKADVIYAQNGASVELPLWLASFFFRTPVVFCIGDAAAHRRAQARWLLRFVERLAHHKAKATVTDVPPKRPIILPLEPRPEAALEAYEAAWSVHMQKLEALFSSLVKK
jgi:hypothetical protein